MTDADGSIVQPDYVMRCWCVTNGISLGWVGVGWVVCVCACVEGGGGAGGWVCGGGGSIWSDKLCA